MRTALSTIEEHGRAKLLETEEKTWLIDRMPVQKASSGGYVKRIAIAFIAVLLTAAAIPAFAVTDRNANPKANVVDEVIRMWKSNVPEEEIVTYVRKVDTRFSVSADDIIDMTDAKVPRTVIKAVLDEADRRDDGRYDRRSTVYVAPAPYYGYGPAYYGPAYYDPFFYDPWFYGPRVSVGIGFGFGHFRGGHFHRRW